MATKIELLLEAEKRGLLPADKLAALNEARRRGLVAGVESPKFEQARESYTKYAGVPVAAAGQEAPMPIARPGAPSGLPSGAGVIVEEAPPEGTTLAGLGGAITRGVAPAAVLAGAGALAAPLVGVAAPVGAALGGGALLASKVLGVDQPFVEKLNELMTRAGVAEPRTAIERLFQSAAGSAADVATGVGGGQVLMKSAAPFAQAAGGILAEQPVTQLASGVSSGLAAQAAAELGANPATQAAAALIGGAAASRGVRTKAGPIAPESVAKLGLVAEAEKVGVPIMTSDVSPPRTFMGKASQAAGERVPFVGTGPLRETQQAARVSAVRSLLTDFGATSAAQASDAVMADLQATRSSEINRYASQKNNVISGLSTAGVVPVTGTTKAIDQQIKKLAALKTDELKPVIDRLKDWRQAIQKQNLTNIEDLRKQLGESFKAPELASVRSTGEKALSSIYGALRDDMGAFIRDNGQPQDIAKWTDANKKLASLAGELKTTALKSALTKGNETPETIRQMLFSTKPSDVRLLYRNLSDAGRANARSALLAQAAEKATTGDYISPEKFMTQVNKLGPQFGIFFKADDKRRVDGLMRVLGATRRAAEANVMTQSGQQAVPAATALAAGQVSGSALGGAALLGTTGLLARLYESPKVRNLLLQIPSTTVGSPEEAAILKRITGALAARTTKPDEEQ